MQYAIIISLLIVGNIIMVVCSILTSQVSGSTLFSNLHVFNVEKPHRASQGIATDSDHIFLTTSINESGKRENIVSVYDMQGKFVKEQRNASKIVDRDGRPMDFGDASILENHLYIPLYNWHSLPDLKMPQYSKVAVFDTKNLSLIEMYDIGESTAEGITFSGGSFWVAYHDEPMIKEFDSHFELVNTYSLKIPSEIKIYDGYFQGISWYNNDVILNIHGPNIEGTFYSPGLVRYHYNGSHFEYVETLKPPTYGSGQGFDRIGNIFYFVDRPANVFIEAHLLEKGN